MTEEHKPLRIDIVSDVVCPWCIIGYRQLVRALEATGQPADIHWHPFELNPDMAESGENLREHLAADGVGTILQWGGWLVHQFDDLELRSDADYAEGFSKRYMMLPMHHMLEDADVEHVCASIRRFYAG